MSKETATIPASAIKDMVEGSGRIKRPRPEAETQARTDRNGNTVDLSTDIPDTLAPVDDVDGQIALNEAMMCDIIGAPIETDDVGVFTSHNAHNLDSDASELTATPGVRNGATELGSPVPVHGNDKAGARQSVDRGGKTSVGTVSCAPATHTTLTEGGKPSAQIVHTASMEPCKTTVPTPQAATDEPSADNDDTLNSSDTVPTLDTCPIRRTAKYRKSDLDEYRRRYMKVPRIADRKPVFVSHTTRDRLDRIVRLLGECGMSVSGLIENIALHHLATHEPDVEHWRKM